MGEEKNGAAAPFRTREKLMQAAIFSVDFPKGPSL